MPRWTRLTNSLSLRDRGPMSYSRGRLARHAIACARPHVATGCNYLSRRHRQRGRRLLRLGRGLCAAPTVDGRENPQHDPRQFGRTRPLGRQDHWARLREPRGQSQDSDRFPCSTIKTNSDVSHLPSCLHHACPPCAEKSCIRLVGRHITRQVGRARFFGTCQTFSAKTVTGHGH